jgi:hypothetical protein
MTVGATKAVFHPSELADLLPALRFDKSISGHQAVIATAVLAARVISEPCLARSLSVKVLTTGSATQTDVMLKLIRAGATAKVNMLNAAIVVDNTDADGTEVSSTDFVDDATQKLEPGDIVLVEVDAAPTGGADLFFTAEVDQRADALVARDNSILIGGGTP